jgi:hypothetical protein
MSPELGPKFRSIPKSTTSQQLRKMDLEAITQLKVERILRQLNKARNNRRVAENPEPQRDRR